MPRNAATNRLKLREIPSSLSFNGSTTTVAYSGAGVTGFASASSFAGWVKIAKGSGTTRIIVGRWGTGGSDRCAICFQQVSPLGSENYALQAGYYNGSTYTVSGTTNVPIETWFHLAYTWDGTTSRSYINGTLLTGTSASPASGATTGLSLGNQSGANWRGNQSMVKLYTRVLTQDEITKLSLMQDDQVDTTGLWVDWHLDEGAGSSVTDYSGNSRTGTITSGTFVYDSPMKARKASVNANMVRNGDFEYAPPFTAATTTAGRYIDGTLSGSTTNTLFGAWAVVSGAITASASASFDTSVFYAGSKSMKLSTLDAAGAVVVANTLSTATPANADVLIPLTPNTSYTLTFRCKTNNVATNSAFAFLREYTAALGTVATNNSTKLSGTNDWTLITLNFTTGSTTRFAAIALCNNVAGNISDAWFDDISLTPVYPEGRVPANGNLVKNFDFEVIPAFTAAGTTSSRWINGTAAGSSTNATYKWSQIIDATSCAISIDGTVSHSGSGSLKVDCLDATGRGRGCYGSRTGTGASLLVSELNLYAIRVPPSTGITMTYWIKTLNVQGGGAKIAVHEHDGAGVRVTSTSATAVAGTADWQQITFTVTTSATTQYLVLSAEIPTAGAAQTAWFDDIYLAKTTNPGRVVIT